MYLFGWRKRLALILCAFLFLGSISYLSGTLSQESKYLVKNRFRSNYLNRSFFNDSSPLKLFNNVLKVSLSPLEKETSRNSFNLASSIQKENIFERTKEFVKSKIFEKLSNLNPGINLDKKNLIGNIFYKWISRNVFWVIVKFKLAILNSQVWFYDNFSVIVGE